MSMMQAEDPTTEQMSDPQFVMERCVALAQESPDLSTQNGAVLVQNNWLVTTGLTPTATVAIATGINRAPYPVKDRLERPEKYLYTEHAERAALHQAAKSGNTTDGSTMYCLWAACADCARAIIGCGVTKVVTHAFYRDFEIKASEGRKDWKSSIADAEIMFAEAGVELEFFEGQVMKPDQSLRFNGEQVHY